MSSVEPAYTRTPLLPLPYPNGTKGVFTKIVSPDYLSNQYSFRSLTDSVIQVVTLKFSAEELRLYITFKSKEMEHFLKSQGHRMDDGDRHVLGYATSKIERIKRIFEMAVNYNSFPEEDIIAVRDVIEKRELSAHYRNLWGIDLNIC